MYFKNINKIFILLLLIVLCENCNIKPLNVIGSKSMEDIIHDLILADAVLDTYPLMPYDDKKAYYDNIYIKYNVSQEKFENSLKWYAHHPKKLELIYEEVKSRLDKMKTDVENYVYHPEAQISDELKMFDTIELYNFQPFYVFGHTPPENSLLFEIDQKGYFALSDKFILRFLMRVDDMDNQKDTLQETSAVFKITYTNGETKELMCRILADGKQYRYTFFPQENNQIEPVKLEINLFNSNELIRNIRIDSLKLFRIYNSEKYPLHDSIKIKLNIPVYTEKEKNIENVINLGKNNILRLSKC